MQPKLKERLATLAVERTVHEGTPAFVSMDATRVMQVVSNVLHNGIKFTPPGGRVLFEVDRFVPEEMSRRAPSLDEIADWGALRASAHLRVRAPSAVALPAACSAALPPRCPLACCSRRLAAPHRAFDDKQACGDNTLSSRRPCFRLLLP